ncbi:MAG: rhomboid family intramembrane serine protease [Solirubrobacteraceae bacterium]
MAGAAELFTVCRSCGQQVSSYVTECPYCGTRLRRRSPTLARRGGDLEALIDLPAPEERPDAPDEDVVVELPEPKRRRGRRTKGPRAVGGRSATPTGSHAEAWGLRRARPRRARRSRGGSGEQRPWATIVLLAVSLVGVPVAYLFAVEDVVLGATDNPVWRYVVAAFVYPESTWHAAAVLTTFGVFGWLWEKRLGPVLGPLVALAVFAVAGVGGLAATVESGGSDLASGAVGAAVALATAWIVAEIRARQTNRSIDGDLLGATVLLIVPVATSIVITTGAPPAALLGAIVGVPLGLALLSTER